MLTNEDGREADCGISFRTRERRIMFSCRVIAS